MKVPYMPDSGEMLANGKGVYREMYSKRYENFFMKDKQEYNTGRQLHSEDYILSKMANKSRKDIIQKQ